ncbi:hypothetical protein B0I72DRAFT_11535 [Yarrowia lipolytica]|jgi:hypothetical protein|uniref:YALI0E09130p n=2 Tax=Yarrowia lipolytica TaxID=4952 RepID=Q6C6J1_YARLI|nr:YALI0E09130p [Yarrowia lipolytica CLIB122]AOW05157.1 hypothetical protein YALI1_E11289g [Yarrowia lipolytica]KAB8282007.1 hypothetical protein BKA91DRAFT_26811 [Yarrowia lipolytica]KAE8173436.1 hypothetical protein BKA90DRAFT_9420 [Yarrowia lipolytica]KAJ8056706.1 hypothetical protein LXG23DRAFT_33599 [Yarrowia lipolytica]QNQ00264.1 Hypothetical protein YALI2_E01579g [Yarrowia lipolytica]|eukprot:XP_503721.1 YALI0E09130p [Yarrowia lipolytica CLIB122]
MFRLARFSASSNVVRLAVARPAVRPFSTSLARFNEQKKPEPELMNTLEQSEFIQKIRNNDRVLHEIAGFQDFMLEKGYVNPDGTRASGLMTMMKMISDKEVGKRLEGLNAVLEQEQIEVTKDDIKSLVAALGMK